MDRGPGTDHWSFVLYIWGRAWAGLGAYLTDNQLVGDYYSAIESPAVDFANGQFQ